MPRGFGLGLKAIQKTIDQKKRAVRTRPFGREAGIIAGIAWLKQA
jgi:hypothetical protein